MIKFNYYNQFGDESLSLISLDVFKWYTTGMSETGIGITILGMVFEIYWLELYV